MTTFSTIDAARAAGYEPVRHGGWGHTYRGFTLTAHDVSGGSSRGYDYELRAEPLYSRDTDLIGAWDSPKGRAVCGDPISDAAFGRTESVWLASERCAVRAILTPGVFNEMFSPATIAAAHTSMERAVDAFYERHPTAWDYELARLQRDREIAAERAASDARYARRYAEKLARKYGVENLTAVHRAALAES